jgi:hypothetical protein
MPFYLALALEATIALVIAAAAIVDRTNRAAAWQEIAAERRWNHDVLGIAGSAQPDGQAHQPAAHDAAGRGLAQRAVRDGQPGLRVVGADGLDERV